MRTLLSLMLALAAPAVLATAAPASAQTGEAAALRPVQALDDGLLASMKAGKAAGVKGRAALLAPVVERSFDLALMTRLVVGPAWTGFSPADQSAVVAAFRRMTIASYADNFDGWSGESFAIDPKVEQRGGDVLVRTRLIVPRQAPVAIAYRLRPSGGEWKIIDVYYNNAISQLATRRADFAGALKSGGAKALIQQMNAIAAKAGG